MDSAATSPPRRRLNRRLAGMAGAATMFVIGAAVAYAAWSATGTGNGQALATQPQAISIKPSTGSPDLYPGGKGALYFSLGNPNVYAVRLTAASIGHISDMAAAACPAGFAALATSTSTGVITSTQVCVDSNHAYNATTNNNPNNACMTSNGNLPVVVDSAYASQVTLGTAINLNAGVTNVSGSLANVLDMDAGASNGCEGATFQASLTLSGTQV